MDIFHIQNNTEVFFLQHMISYCIGDNASVFDCLMKDSRDNYSSHADARSN
jgi:hypothetical protein